MKFYDRIIRNVTKVDFFAFSLYMRMFSHHEPAHMREEETSSRVMRIRWSLWELMVYSVVTNPVVYFVLQ